MGTLKRRIIEEMEPKEMPPMLAIGNDELASQPLVGETIDCEMCGGVHQVEYGKKREPDGTWAVTTMLSFFKCGGRVFLAGVNRRRLPKRGVTLIEVLVVAAILATLVGLLMSPFLGSSSSDNSPPSTIQMITVQHDSHWWILCRETAIHHPDCPCRGRNLEAQ